MPSAKEIIRRACETANDAIAWIGRNKIYRPELKGVVKVNVGCGLAVAPGWVNVDGSLNALISAFPKPLIRLGYTVSGASEFYEPTEYVNILTSNVFVHHDLSNGLPLPAASADYVYSSHFLEHMEESEASRLIQECFRILKPGGIARISVPDLDIAWRMYASGQRDKMLRDYFFGGGASRYAQHRWAYDFESLNAAMHHAGFVRVEKLQYRRGRVPDLGVLDNREEYSLYIEGEHP